MEMSISSITYLSVSFNLLITVMRNDTVYIWYFVFFTVLETNTEVN